LMRTGGLCLVLKGFRHAKARPSVSVTSTELKHAAVLSRIEEVQTGNT
jgi:hypothetical protein